MRKFHVRAGLGIALAIVLTTAGVTVAQFSAEPPADNDPIIPEMDSGEQGDSPDALSTNCRKTFSSGSGTGAFDWCFSDDGNVVTIENSAGLEHVAVGTITEGWCVSSDGVQRGATFGSSANTGLGSPIYTADKKVAHRTTDGVLRVETTFGNSPFYKRIIMTMKVRNVSDGPVNQVYLTRFIDADMSNTTSGDTWIAADRSVAAMEPGSSRLELIPSSTEFPAFSQIYSSFFPSLDDFCYDGVADTTNEETGDRSMGVTYNVGTIPPGADRTLRFVYRISV